VALLRERLGLEPGDSYDETLAAAVHSYRHVHGLGAGSIADAATIASLNRGAGYYEALIRLNLERLRALPADGSGRFILVDAAAQRLWLYEDGEAVDSMKVVVGKTASPTPMFATLIYAAEVNPYWNIPPDLVQKLVAPKVVKQGIGYLAASGYDVLSSWGDGAQLIDPLGVDWQAVAAGRENVRVRQQPGGSNAMGALKLYMPNRFGVYLHDTPDKQLFAGEDRRRSNGCIRLEDAARLARWLFGEMPTAPDAGTMVALAKPVPVYVTYLTAATDPVDGLVFRADPYGRDRAALAELDGSPFIETASLR
jgi:murein L,D-transpeptidase YcbB/YkuD